MKISTAPLLALFALAVTGCSSLTKLENVAGDWSCPLVDGVCADIATIDASLLLNKANASPVSGPQTAPRSPGFLEASISDGVTPNRSTEEVARIVFAPSIDGSGHFHGERAMFAVMRNTLWSAPDAVQGEETYQLPTHVRPVESAHAKIQPAVSSAPIPSHNPPPPVEGAGANSIPMPDVDPESVSEDVKSEEEGKGVERPGVSGAPLKTKASKNAEEDHAAITKPQQLAKVSPRVKPEPVIQAQSEPTMDVADYLLARSIPVISAAQYQKQIGSTVIDEEPSALSVILGAETTHYTTDDLNRLTLDQGSIRATQTTQE